MAADGSSRPDEHSVVTLDRQQQQDTSSNVSDPEFVHPLPAIKSSEALITTTEAPARPNAGVVRLGLHEQYVEVNVCLKTLVVDMEIRAAVGKTLKPELGFVELHYMELHAAQLSSDSDHSLRVHRPYLWSIDVAHTVESADNKIYNKSTRIIHFAVSGDGTHVATLSTIDTKLYLDVWDLEPESSVHIDPPQKDTLPPPYHPSRCAHKQLHLKCDINPSLVVPVVIVSISWDASKIAVISNNSLHLTDTFQVFARNAELRLLSETQPVSSPTHSLTPLDVNRLCKQLKGATGSGKFLIIASEKQDPKDELFVTCNDISVDVYSIRDTWHHIRKIHLVNEAFRENPKSTWGNRRLIDGMRGRYFAWRDNKGTITICNLETGLFVSRIPNGQNACFSSDGSMVTIRHSDATITTRWVETNLCISTMDENHRSPAFIQGDRRVLVPLVEPDETYGRGQLGVILDTMSMDVVSRVSVPLSTFEGQQIVTSADGNNLYSLHGSKLNLVCFNGTTLQPYAQTRGRCDEQSLCDVEIVGAMTGSVMDKEAVVTMSSGLTFTAGFETIRKGYMSEGVEHCPLIVSISDGRTRVQEAFIVPAAPMGDILNDWLAYKATFNIERQEMIVYNNLFCMVWGLPKTLDGSFTLLLNWWIQHLPFQITNNVYWLWSGLSQCPHQRYYAFLEDLDEQYMYIMVDAVQLDTDNPFGCKYTNQSLDGVLVLIEIFSSGDKQFKDAILQYVGRHLNNYPNPDNLVESILGRICQNVNQENYSRYTEFLRALFDSPHGNWVPRKDYNHKTNPIWMLLTLAETFPRAMNLARVLIDYCVHKANKEKNWHFASPVLGPLHVLVHRKNIYAQIVHDTLRNLAFIPTMDRSYVIDHHTIAHPPELRWSFWLPNQTPLQKCKDPILQLDYNLTPTKHNLQTDNFTRDIFVASFDLLWLEPESPASVKDMNDQPSHSWISTILHATWLNCKIKSKTTVECHDFALEQLDNPAIAALVEYKW
ncbi:hypothetical protein BG011_007675 [Mortierella polycephala]|uniref:Uncharacterized protein n=1 Tax=Mortierella polycephala TaxID=41804 RepID=A0A9P6QJX7_9FUNG|nr:hypothetical protein BG011_007675 [Mortierella polycephala]